MLVVHPKDRTTRMLAALYEGQQVRLFDQNFSSAEINRALFHTSRQERILLLGHGSDQGLFSRENDEADGFDRLIVSHTHAYALRRHGGNLMGDMVSCPAFCTGRRASWSFLRNDYYRNE